MNIRPSAAIRQNYNEIAALCRSTQAPVYLTKNGEGDLVVMDIDSFARREKMLALREQLLSVEETGPPGEPAARWKNWTTIWTAFWAGRRHEVHRHRLRPG